MTDVTYITAQDFNNTRLKFDHLSIVECINNNNALLKVMESVLIKLQNSVSIQFKHLRIDPRNNSFIVNKFHVQQEPSYLIFFNGEFIDRLDGIISYNEFSQRMEQQIKNLKMEIN